MLPAALLFSLAPPVDAHDHDGLVVAEGLALLLPTFATVHNSQSAERRTVAKHVADATFR